MDCFDWDLTALPGVGDDTVRELHSTIANVVVEQVAGGRFIAVAVSAVSEYAAPAADKFVLSNAQLSLIADTILRRGALERSFCFGAIIYHSQKITTRGLCTNQTVG